MTAPPEVGGGGCHAISMANLGYAAGRVAGELRWLSPVVELLGLLMIQFGRHLIGPFPFSLSRSKHYRRRRREEKWGLKTRPDIEAGLSGGDPRT